MLWHFSLELDNWVWFALADVLAVIANTTTRKHIGIQSEPMMKKVSRLDTKSALLTIDLPITQGNWISAVYICALKQDHSRSKRVAAKGETSWSPPLPPPLPHTHTHSNMFCRLFVNSNTTPCCVMFFIPLSANFFTCGLWHTVVCRGKRTKVTTTNQVKVNLTSLMWFPQLRQTRKLLPCMSRLMLPQLINWSLSNLYKAIKRECICVDRVGF